MYAREDERRLKDGRAVAQPAPPAPHALLALQRSAGNQAVAGVLARQKVNDQRRNGLVKKLTTGKNAETTADGLLLAMYVEVGAAAKPALGPWDDVETAITKLKEAKKIDDEDVAKFSEAATARFAAASGSGKKAAAMAEAGLEKLKADIAKNRKRMDAAHKHHIFHGDFKGDMPTGFHSKYLGSSTHETYGDPTAVSNGVSGVYQQSVRSKKSPKTKKEYQSTFFPDTVSDDDVMDAITGVYGVPDAPSTVRWPESLKGLTLDSLGETIFPGGGKNAKAAPGD
jgi:hypothetical protein